MEVAVSKSIWRVGASQHGVEGVDVAHILHKAKGKVLLDIGSTVHPRGNGVHESVDLRQVSLSTSRKVLYRWLVTAYMRPSGNSPGMRIR